MVINIRRSRPDEGDKLTAIWCRSVDATHDFLTKAYRKELEEMVRAFLPEAPLWVAVNTEDQPIAFMLLTGDHMDALFVDPDVRGCGVGKLKEGERKKRLASEIGNGIAYFSPFRLTVEEKLIA